jgi:hypothetical protein
MLNFISPKIRDFEKSTESFYKEDKFFMTKSNINKNTSININKIFFPDKYKKKSDLKILEESFKKELNNSNTRSLSNSLSKSKSKSKIKIKMNENYKNKDIEVNRKNINRKKSKIYPINHKTILEKKGFSENNSNLTKSLNRELSRISNIYGNNKSMGKFTKNPIADKHYEENNYYAYEISKQNEFQKVNFKPKLKPLIMRETNLNKMTKNIFFLNQMKIENRK